MPMPRGGEFRSLSLEGQRFKNCNDRMPVNFAARISYPSPSGGGWVGAGSVDKPIDRTSTLAAPT